MSRFSCWISALKKAQAEHYDFTNIDRDYDGYLSQYTLQGKGLFEAEGEVCPLLPGTAFFSLIPENSRYYLPAGEPADCWEYFYIHFQGTAALPFFRKIRDSFGYVLSLPADSFPVQMWLNLHEDMGKGRQLRRYEGGELVYRFLSSLLRTLESPAMPGLSSCVEDSILYMKEHFPEHFSHRRTGRPERAFFRLFYQAFYPGNRTGPFELPDGSPAFPCPFPASESHPFLWRQLRGNAVFPRKLFLQGFPESIWDALRRSIGAGMGDKAPAITVLCRLHLPGLLNPRLPRGTMLFRSFLCHGDVTNLKRQPHLTFQMPWAHLNTRRQQDRKSIGRPWGGGDQQSGQVQRARTVNGGHICLVGRGGS